MREDRMPKPEARHGRTKMGCWTQSPSPRNTAVVARWGTQLVTASSRPLAGLLEGTSEPLKCPLKGADCVYGAVSHRSFTPRT